MLTSGSYSLNDSSNNGKEPLLQVRSNNTTHAVMTAIAVKPKPEIRAVVKHLERRNKFNNCAQFVIHHQGKLTAAGALIMAAASFGVLWTQYYFPQIAKNSEWELLLNRSHAQYSESGCPEGSYWYHPEVYVRCESGEGIYDKKDVLLSQDDYCLGSTSCESDFPEELIDQLSPVCMLLMHDICNTIDDLKGDGFIKILSVIVVLICVPILLASICIVSIQQMGKKLSVLSFREEEEVKEILVDRRMTGMDSHNRLGYMIRLAIVEEVQKQFASMQMPRAIVDIILACMDDLSLQKPATCLLVQKELSRAMGGSEEKMADSGKDSFLYRLFKQIPPDCDPDHPMRAGKHHCREGLGPEAVADRVMRFIG